MSCGLVTFLSVLRARPTRSLRQALAIVGVAGFGTAIGIHPLIGYTTGSHLAPAVFGAFVFVTGLSLSAAGAIGTRSR